MASSQHVGSKDIWSVGCGGDSVPSLCSSSRNAGSWMSGADPNISRIIAKQRHRSAGDTAQQGPPPPMAVSVGAGRQRPGPAHRLELAPGSGQTLTALPRPGGLAGCAAHIRLLHLLGRRPASSHKHLARPALRPRRLCTEGQGANACRSQDALVQEKTKPSWIREEAGVCTRVRWPRKDCRHRPALALPRGD